MNDTPSVTADAVIASCNAYEPYRLRTPQEQMSYGQMMQTLDQLRSIHLGTPKSMAVGLAINILKTINPGDYWDNEKKQTKNG
ncbi:MAG: hypothetical protein IJ649_03170 [Oscillospiraceae bacterium]|nr:hypothetical protein [Oscillospiraceae bacterium]